ncbi:MAG TPA: DUF4245 domain-containing protein [Pseudonocardiaceae bacterium]|nr:DUF4245 domain-containing protein [Pseudonocardiaceae bacterium]
MSDTETGPNRDTAAGPTGAPEQVPAGGRGSGRGRAGMRDMLWSMLVLGLGILLLAGLTKGCSFSPGGPSADSTATVQVVDVQGELRAAAGQVKFPLREPRLPAGWRANSDSVDPLGSNGTDQAVRVGWITPGDRYLQVSQSDADVMDLVRSAAGLADDVTVRPTGTETVNGTKWTVYPGIRAESSWVTDLGTDRLFITGNGTTAEFRTLAVATMTGQRVTAVGGP